MTEFKFPCPICGQRISCDAVHAGTQIACPGCANRISVPRGFDDPPVPQPPTTAPPKLRTGPTSALAIASLICSLSSLVICVGWIPGIICGHLARARIRRFPALQGNRLALAGLIVSYSTVVFAIGLVVVGVLFFGAAFKQAFQQARSEWAANNPAGMPTQPGAPGSVSNLNQQVDTPQAVPPSQFGWTLDLKDVAFPANPVSGKIHGVDFALKRAIYANGNLRLNSDTPGFALTIQGLGPSIENSSHEFLPASGSDAPQITITWNEDGQPGSAKFSTGYAMKLKCDKMVKRKVHAQIYLCLPDDSKSYLAGSFTLMLPKKKP